MRASPPCLFGGRVGIPRRLHFIPSHASARIPGLIASTCANYRVLRSYDLKKYARNPQINLLTSLAYTPRPSPALLPPSSWQGDDVDLTQAGHDFTQLHSQSQHAYSQAALEEVGSCRRFWQERGASTETEEEPSVPENWCHQQVVPGQEERDRALRCWG